MWADKKSLKLLSLDNLNSRKETPQNYPLLMCITKQDREDREIIGGRSCHQWQGCTQMFTLLLMVTKNLPWLVAKAVDCISCCHGDASILITNTVCTVVCEREGHWERGRWGRVKEKDKEEMSVCSFEQTWGFQRINQRVKHSICGAWECVRCCITFCVWDEACISALSYTHSLTHTHTHTFSSRSIILLPPACSHSLYADIINVD